MWAGPLATWLLASLGAEVTKVEPSFRPDGLRAVNGGGIHPDDRPCDPGRDSAMWNALNEGKTVIDLDLRRADDRARFLEEAAASDVVIDSFSPRVMPNFGMDLPDGPVYVSMPAFPPGRHRDWVAYGTGVHALSGLGDVGGGRYAAPAVSYPDPVAGFTAALAATAAVTARRRGFPVGWVECPLADSVQPLVSLGPEVRRAGPPGGDDEPLTGRAEGIGARLLGLADVAGLTERRSVCSRPLPHPATVFPSKQNVF
jgi:crotonobetainyl-CoA:carnitine CoA-transferase CaiB-like acyl-CoA transferase